MAIIHMLPVEEVITILLEVQHYEATLYNCCVLILTAIMSGIKFAILFVTAANTLRMMKVDYILVHIVNMLLPMLKAYMTIFVCRNMTIFSMFLL